MAPLVVEQLDDMVGLEPGLSRELADHWLAVQPIVEKPVCSPQGTDLPADVDRDRNHTRMSLGRALNRVLDRRRCIGREAEAQPVVELLHRPCQREISLLDQVEQRNVAIRVLPCNPDDQTQIRFDQELCCVRVSGVPATEECSFFRPRQDPDSANCVGVQRQRIVEYAPCIVDALLVASTRVSSTSIIDAHLDTPSLCSSSLTDGHRRCRMRRGKPGVRR
jgi:hypothetical protein